MQRCRTGSAKSARTASSVIIVSVAVIAIFTVSITYFSQNKARKHSSTAPKSQNHLAIPSFPDVKRLLNILCEHTLFPNSCLRELSSFKVDISALANPAHFVSLAVQAAFTRVNEAYQLAIQSSREPGLHFLESQCSHDCIELMKAAEDSLSASVTALSNLHVADITSLRAFLRDVKVWLSATLSYQTACSDCFELAPGKIQMQIQAKQTYVTEVVGNGLFFVDVLAQIGNSLGSWLHGLSPISPIIHLRRRLLSEKSIIEGNDSHYEIFGMHEGFPHWVSIGERKLLQAPTAFFQPDMTVAQDGSGDFLNVTSALTSIPPIRRGRYVIYIKKGVYNEVFNVTKDLKNLTFVGDGISKTVITGGRNVASGLFTTYRTSTVAISGSGFYARDITFQNTAGPGGHQAVALRSAADFLVFYRCSFEGYQDTLYALSSRQFFRECMITGTVDFIFGNAIAVFQNCDIVARLPMQGQQNTITAQGRKLSADVSGYSFQNCTIRGEPSLLNAAYPVSTYLGRPWKAYSRVLFLQSQMEALVAPQGWVPWNSSSLFEDTVFYGEYANRGPGSDTQQRVAWAGVKPNLTLVEATQFNVQNFLAGEKWLGSYSVEYQGALS